MSADAPEFTVAVCTRERPRQLRAALDALERDDGFEILVVDQSAQPLGLSGNGRLRLVHDRGRGLSRARNLALDAVAGEWIAFVDDDCIVEPGFGHALSAALAAHPEADWLSGHVGAGRGLGDDMPVVTTFPVERERVLRGRWTLPGHIGFGVFFAVRISTARRLGGWDERLGPGVAEFPAADDMDFNYRLLRSGGVAVLTPTVRVVHDQWRSPPQLVELQRGYLRAWAGFAMKQLRSGDVAGSLWLWAWGAIDVLDMAKSALSRRSRLRARLAAAKLAGLAEGTVLGLRRLW